MLTLEFLTIPDPDGWHPSLRLKGDWLIFKISDGVNAGYGEASHSKQDDECRRVANALFKKRIASFNPTIEKLKELEQEISATAPDFVTATAWSGINQALYDLLAKREQVPVWQLFRDKPGSERLALYTTINRALKNRSNDEYLELVGKVNANGFKTFKCAPFEEVVDPDNTLETSKAGLETLSILRRAFPGLGIRVDFHERFSPANFFEILPVLESLELDWIEEPFAMGDDYTELRNRTHLRIAGGELFWGNEIFRTIMENQWVHIIMPDVKHVGGFGPLLNVLEMARGNIEVSPHNPSGPISTAASLHAAVLFPDSVKSLEYAFDGAGTRQKYGERVENGLLYLNEKPGWGIEP
jgi:galactonate dehydratase